MPQSLPAVYIVLSFLLLHLIINLVCWFALVFSICQSYLVIDIRWWCAPNSKRTVSILQHKNGQITQCADNYRRNVLIASTLTSLAVYILYLIISVIFSIFSRLGTSLAVLKIQWQPLSDDSTLMKLITFKSASCHWFLCIHFHKLFILVACLPALSYWQVLIKEKVHCSLLLKFPSHSF